MYDVEQNIILDIKVDGNFFLQITSNNVKVDRQLTDICISRLPVI